MTEEVEVIKILGTVDPKTKEISKGKKVTFVKAGAIVMVRIACVQSVLIEKFSDYPQLGRFTLRDEGAWDPNTTINHLVAQSVCLNMYARSAP